jgi:outer membrane protein
MNQVLSSILENKALNLPFQHIMKKHIISFSFLLTAAIGQAYTLDECLQIAHSNSHRSKIAHLDVDLAKAAKNEAFSYLLPRFQLEGRYELKNSQRDYSVFTDFGSSFSSKTIGVTGNLLIFDFLSTWNFYRAGQWNVVAAEKCFEKTLVLLDEEVKTCYFRYLETIKGIQVIEESIRSLHQQLQTTKDYFEQGMISKTDVLSVEVLLAEKKKSRLRAYNDRIEAQMALNRLLGQELLEPLSLEEVPMNAYANPSVDSLQKLALSHRSDRLALQAQIQALDSRYRASKAMHAPKFFLFGGYNFLESAPPQGSKMNTSDKNWLSGGIGMQLPIYEGGKTQSQADKALAQLTQAKEQLEELDTQVAMEVEKSYLFWQEQLANISIEETAILLAEETLRSVTDRYSQGLVSINDVLKANEQLSQSKMGQNRSIYRYHIAYAHLNTVVGGKL